MRVQLKNGKQKELIYKVKNKAQFTWKDFSEFLNVSESCIIEWSRENNLLPFKIFKRLDKNNEYEKHIVKIRKEKWGQSKGGLNSSGSLKEIKTPKKSKELAELVGIILGDGNINYIKKGKKIGTYMVRISGDKRYEYDYLTKYVSSLFMRLFSIGTKISKRKGNDLSIIVHSKKLVKFFISLGLKSGNKITNQVTIPKWIFKKEEYLKSCIRGLIDTDGCIYTLKPHYPNYYQLSFKNHNIKLLKDLRKAFLKLNYPISNISKNKQIYLTQKLYINKFYKEIGFSNKKHRDRYKHSPVV
ncbi:hypothetical protein CMO93_05350 [Candidatus Woesearchaeota archaeon]|nr:hypothetical protein [Candidatus Woesearchaeota archaeon]|tara:strand:- start:32761 stop:33660 length:900 start_codon:yes stop_codon:yes gene_type:complete